MSLRYQCVFLALKIAVIVALASCAGDDARKGAIGAQRAQRVISLDYCADQYVLKFVDPENIVALSPDAEEPFSYLVRRPEACGKSVLLQRIFWRSVPTWSCALTAAAHPLNTAQTCWHYRRQHRLGGKVGWQR